MRAHRRERDVRHHDRHELLRARGRLDGGPDAQLHLPGGLPFAVGPVRAQPWLAAYATDSLSRYRVRFRMPVEHTGRVVFAAWTGWVILCFVVFSLHTAPLARSPFRGGFAQEPLSNNFVGLAPDRIWLGFMQSRSEGALSRRNPARLTRRASSS